MIESLPLYHRIAGKPVIVLGSGEAAAAKRRLVERAGGGVVADMTSGIAQGARIAFVCHADDAQALADVERLRAAGLLVNATDRPELCDFTVPSILDRAPVVVAIGTGGASAGLAKALRLRLEALLPTSLGALASGLDAARARLRERWPDAADRRRALDEALSEGGALDPLDSRASQAIAGWLEGERNSSAGELVEINLASPDPEELTLRTARLLGSADTIAHEAEVPAAILDRGRADAVRVILRKGEQVPPGPGLIIVLRYVANRQG